MATCEFRSIVIIDSGDPDHAGDDGADRGGVAWTRRPAQ
jgi:hypothetical protein